MDKELKDLLADLYKHYKESHWTQSITDDGSGQDEAYCYGCCVEVHYDEHLKEWPPLIHKETCPTVVMGNRIKAYLKTLGDK